MNVENRIADHVGGRQIVDRAPEFKEDGVVRSSGIMVERQLGRELNLKNTFRNRDCRVSAGCRGRGGRMCHDIEHPVALTGKLNGNLLRALEARIPGNVCEHEHVVF